MNLNKKTFIIFIIILLASVFNPKKIHASYEVKNRLIADKTTITVGESTTVKINESLQNIDFNKNTVITGWVSSDPNVLKIEVEQVKRNTTNSSKTYYSKNAKVTGNKKGTATVKVYYETQFGTSSQTGMYYSSIEIKINSLETNIILDGLKNNGYQEVYYKSEIKDKSTAIAAIRNLAVNDGVEDSLAKKVNPNFKIQTNLAGVNLTDSDKIYSTGEISLYFDNKTSGNDLSSYNKTKKQWERIKLKSNTRYAIIYDFYFFENYKKLLYVKTYQEVVKNGNETISEATSRVTQEASALHNDTKKQIDQQVSQYIRAQIASINGNEEREINSDYKDVLDDIDDYIPKVDNSNDAKEFGNIIGKILGVITSIGIVLSVIIPAILGIKYILGSVEEKAEYKKDIIPYLVGAILLFSVCTVVKILQAIGNDINNI